MRSVYLTILMILLTIPSKGVNEIVAIRNLFYHSIKNSDSAAVLYQKLKAVNNNNAAGLIAYKGMSNLMICYHSYNPYTKYKLFMSGKHLLEQAIVKDPNNIELRFLRLTVQLNVPPFLGYSNNINEDKLAIFNGLKILSDKDLFVRIYNYTMNAKKISSVEKQQLQIALSENGHIKQKKL
jgi:hypothetical protein